MNPIELDERGLVISCPECGQRNRMVYERLGQTARCGRCHNELRAPGEPVDITAKTAFDALTGRSALPVVVDFWAPWCGPCRMVAPELVKVAAESAGRWIVAKVNTEELPEIGQRFRINSIPTLAVFEAGREVARQAGAMPAPAIRRFVEQSVRSGVAA